MKRLAPTNTIRKVNKHSILYESNIRDILAVELVLVFRAHQSIEGLANRLQASSTVIEINNDAHENSPIYKTLCISKNPELWFTN